MASRWTCSLNKEAKEFAKAIKADNAEIPVYLWNDRIWSPGIIREEQVGKMW
jgi:hypothetical protein